MKKINTLFLHRILSILALSASLGLSATHAATQDWDGTGTWDVANTPNWNGANTWANLNYAHFGSAQGGAVTVDDQGGAAPVVANQMYFYNSGGSTAYTFSGTSITTGDDNTAVYIDSAVSLPVTYNNQIIVNENNHAFYGDQTNFSNASTSTLTLGAIDVQDTNALGQGYQLISLNQAAGGKIVLSGPITASGAGTALLFGINGPSSPAGTYEITGSVQSGIGIALFQSQTLLLGTDNLGGANLNIIGSDYTTPTRILTVGARNISDTIGNQNDKADEFGGSTADVSNFNGVISPFATVTLSAVAGGRVNFNNVIQNEVGGGLKTAGAGTIALNNASGNTYGLVDGSMGYSTGTVAAVLGAARTLINNTSGSAFSNNAGTTVSLLANSSLGGTGISTEKVIAVAGSSILAPGDSGADGGTATIGTLHLLGGLQAASGVTLAFKINGNAGFEGTNNDLLDFGAGDFTPAGNVTFDFTNLGAIQTSQPGSPNFYTVVSGSGFWDDSGITGYTFNAPPGYVVARYTFDSFGDTFAVDFQVVPEPSTYALMLGGLAVLAFCVRRKNRA
jgi:hypothetical protein